MDRLARLALTVAAACTHAPPPASSDASIDAISITADAADTCSASGAPGTCITTTACAALGDHTSFPNHCAGPADIQCCITTPGVANNPPTPAGYKPMMDAEVTPEMTTWAVMILHDTATYPLFATATMPFGTLEVLARVEWHPPDFQNGVVHRGVTLYEPI